MNQNFQSGFNNLWPTVIYKTVLDVQEDIITEALCKTVHSSIDKIALEHFDIYLKKTIGVSISDYSGYKLLSWVNRYENTEMEYHTHNGSHLSAVFYPVVEGEGGEIVFYDPRFFAARGYDMNFRKLHSSMTYKPEPGALIIFPSYLYHSVKSSKGFKLSIPVDLFLYNEG
jgi:hypothetical protein